MSESHFSDSSFRDKLIGLVIKDRSFLRQCAPVLDKKDFDLNGASSKDDKIKAAIAQIGLDHYSQYNEPIGTNLKAEIVSHCKKQKFPEAWRKDAVLIARKYLVRKIKAPAYIVDKVIDYKKEQAKKNAITQLIDLQEAGKLTDDKWQETTNSALLPVLQDKFKPINYFARLEKRISRRKLKKDNRFPVLFIEPLDRRIRILARGHLGLVLAPYKRGKSLFLLHCGLALTLQKYNILYFTLEDPLEDVEDRLDAAVSFIPIKKLGKMPKALRIRFTRFKRFVKRRFKIVDGTEGGMTVARIQSIIDQERNIGFYPDAVIIDYDEELQAKHRNKERRMEFDEIYRDLRKLAAKNQIIVWTAAQSKRGTTGNKIVTGDDAAEDISKIKKSSICLSLGQGDWGEESIYIHVAAHKHDKQHIGVNIVSDLDKMRIYDPVKTARAQAQHPEMKKRVK